MRKLTRGFVKVLATLVLGGACLGLGLQANAVLLNFETLSDGVTVPLAQQSAQTEYASQGVTFAGGGTAGQPVFRNYNSLSSAIAALPIGNNWFITTLDHTGGGSNFDVDIFFNKPVYSASGDVVINPNYSMQVSAYDAANTLLASSSVPAGASTWIAGSFSFSTGTPIAHIKLLPSSPAAAAGLDNLRFATNPTVASPLVATPPVIDGFVGFGEWPSSGQLNLQHGFIRVVNDGIRLYVLVDLLNDSGDDAGDYFYLTFDTNRNGTITPSVDQNYGLVGDNMRYQYYLGPNSWTGVQPTTYSSRAKGFGCFFADGSLKFVFPFSLTCNSHRVWELAIDLAEIGAAPGSYVRMGLRAASPSPAFTEDTPVSFTSDFSNLIIVNLAAAVLPPANPSASIVLDANPIEITQAIQTRTNTMPLVADKTGVARVYVDVNGVAVSQPSIVNLYGTKAGVDLPGSPLASLHMAPTAINREQLNNTANFQLPTTWDNGTVAFKAAARSRLGSLSSSTPFSLAFSDKRKPNYWIVPINTGTALAPVLASNADIASQESYLKAVYPVAGVNFVRKPWQVIGPTTVGNTIDDLNTYYNNVVLAWILSVLFGGGAPYDLPDQIYGFTPSGGGISDPTWFNSGAGRVARGFQGTSIEGTMAHEINHNLDRSATGTWGRHVPLGCGAGGPDPSWPYANDDIQEVGFDTRLPWTVVPPPRTAVPANFPDFMSYCQSGTLPTKWISPYRWQNMFGVLPALAPVAATPELAAAAKIQPVYYVSGRVNINGTGALNPILAQYGMPTEQVTPGEYLVELLDAAGLPLMRVPFFVMFEDVEGNKVDTVAFNFQLPAVQGVAAVVLRLGSRVLATIKVSRNAPVVRLITPNGGERWSGFQKVAWEAGDVDGDALSFSLLYSPSGGKTWLPVAAGLTGNSYQINTALLQGSNAGLLRIIVTDGFNTAQDDSDGVFGVAGNPPEVHVNAPADGAQLPAGAPIHFDGDATDTEDGTLPETAFVWLDGDVAIGQGRVVDAALPGGKHTITLAVSDSQGLVGKASVQIQVGQDSDGDGVFDDKDNCTQVANPDQRDTNGDGYGNMCDGDLNNDGATNTIDLNIYKAVHRSKLGDPNYNPDADFNGDGAINTIDLNIYKGLHRKPPGPSGLAP